MTCNCAPGAMVPLDDFLPYVLPGIGDVPEAIAAHAVRLAAIEFSAKTFALRMTMTLDAQQNVVRYSLRGPEGMTISTIIYVMVGHCVYETNQRQVGFGRHNSYTFDKSEKLLYLNPAPPCDEKDGIEIRASVMPGQDTCYLPTHLYEDFAEVLADGALKRLYRMKVASWYDETSARTHERMWNDGLRHAKASIMQGGSSTPVSMRVPRAV